MTTEDALARKLGDEMMSLLRRIGEQPCDVGRRVASRIDECRNEPAIADAIAELHEVFETPNP